MREKNKALEKELNKMETMNIPEAKFKTLAMRMLKKLSENFNSIKKKMKTIKKNQSALASMAQLVGVLSHKLKDHGFNSQSGHIPRLQVWSQSGCIQEMTD